MNNSKNLSLSSILVVSAEDVENVSLDTSTENTEINFGGLIIRSWDNGSGYHMIGRGTGKKEEIVLEGFEAVAGFFNAAMFLRDNPKAFSILNTRQHVYSSAAGRTSTQAAGYALVEELDPKLGLPTMTWFALRKENNGYKSAGAQRPVNYNQSNTWKTEEARKENEHIHHIVNLHNGINNLLLIAAGTHYVTFKTFGWSEKSKSILNDKKFAMQSTPEYRASLKKDAGIRKQFGDVMKQASKSASNGTLRVASSAPASYVDSMNTEVSCDLTGLNGKTFEICRSDGTSLAYRRSVNRSEEGATALALARSIGGFLRDVTE